MKNSAQGVNPGPAAHRPTEHENSIKPTILLF